nr:SRP72 RNA-binding domain-containing protein [Tanacetum cinerariifolium]
CKSIGLRSVIRFDDQELKKVIWYVLHNNPEIDSDICLPSGKDGEMYYGELQEILEFSYLLFKVVLFRVKWFDTRNEGRKVKHLVLKNNMTQIWVKEDDPDVIRFDNSFDLALSTSLNDLDFVTLHIDGQSTDAYAPPDIIDVDEDDEIINDKDSLPCDLADSDDEDLVNVVDDDVAVVYSSEEED